ncbi:MAG: hypothetical protein GF364_02080 [Candidatus Lokiarchaeota archaeon]|nr:hypothetical protein [Candidatus Lokiarchaeota archaeon]
MELSEKEQILYDALMEFEEDDVLDQVDELLADNVDPLRIADICKEAMDEVGIMFQDKEIFLTELIMAGELLNIVMEKLGFKKGTQDGDDSDFKGKIVIGTVKGDVHDIGKNIVTSLLASKNYKIIDLGVDVTPDKFVEAVKENNPQVVGMSGLLTLAYDSMKATVDALVSSGLRDGVKIMIGGGAVDEKVRKHVDADAFGNDATDAVVLMNKWIK